MNPKTDIVGNVPTEICHEILSYLSVNDLGRFMQVCRNWRSKANYDRMWFRHYSSAQFGIEPTPVINSLIYKDLSELEPLCSWARLYSSSIRLFQMWERNNPRRYMIKAAGLIIVWDTDGKTLATVVNHRRCEIWDIESSPRKIQEFRLTPEITCRHIKIATNSKFVVISQYGAVVLYKLNWRRKIYEPCMAIKITMVKRHSVVSEDRNPSSFSHFLKTGKDQPYWNVTPGIYQDILFVHCKGNSKLYFWKINGDRSYQLGLEGDLKIEGEGDMLYISDATQLRAVRVGSLRTAFVTPFHTESEITALHPTSANFIVVSTFSEITALEAKTGRVIATRAIVDSHDFVGAADQRVYYFLRKWGTRERTLIEWEPRNNTAVRTLELHDHWGILAVHTRFNFLCVNVPHVLTVIDFRKKTKLYDIPLIGRIPVFKKDVFVSVNRRAIDIVNFT